LVIRSIGEIRADLDFGPDGGQIDLEAEKLSFSRIAENLGLPKNEFEGELNANVHLLVGAHSEGTVDIEMTDGAIAGVDNVALDAHATLEGTRTHGNVNGSIASLGAIESSWEGELAGPLHLPSSYEKATGKTHSEIHNLDLKGLSLLLGKTLGLPDLSGGLSLTLDVERDSATDFPAAEMSFETTNLTIPFETDAEKIVVTGLVLEGVLSVRPQEELLEGVVRLNDHHGT
jgi:hypothetical protein